MTRVGQNLEESDLLMGSTTPTEQSTDDIKLSLNRIEELLNRGHQLLYGEEAEMAEGKGAGHGVDADEPHAMTQHDVAGISSSTKSSHMPTTQDFTSAQAYDTEVSPLTPVSTPTASVHVTSTNVSPAAAKRRQAYGAHPRTRQRSRTGSFAQKPVSNEEKLEKEMMSLSASARGARLSDIKKRTGKVIALEEGVDENDKPQDIPIESLKDRIHRELEEYRRNGPLMAAARHGGKPARKSALASTAPAAAGTAPRTRFGFAPVPAKDSRALATTTDSAEPSGRKRSATAAPPAQLRPAPTRARTTIPSNTYGRTGAAHAPVPATTTTKSGVAATRPSRGTRTTAVAPTASRARTAPAGSATAAAGAPARRAAPTAATAVAPRSVKSKSASAPARTAAKSTESGAGEEAGAAPRRVPVWERLYSHAATQEQSLKRRREMQRAEARAMANTTMGKAHSHARPSQRHRDTEAKIVPAQAIGVTLQPFRPLALEETREIDFKNASVSAMRLSSNPRLSRSASMQRRSSGTTNVIPMVRPQEEDALPSKAVARKTPVRQSTQAPRLPEQTPTAFGGPTAHSVSPVPMPPPSHTMAYRPSATTSTTPDPSKRLQLDQPAAEKEMTYLEEEGVEEEDAASPQVPLFVRPLDLRGIKK